MKRLTLSLAILSLAQTPALATPFEDGVKLYNDKRFRESLVKFEEQLKSRPTDANVNYWAALASQQSGDINSARKYYRAVMSSSPSSTIGGYARSILQKIDPSFVATAGVPVPAATAETVNPNLPRECDVNCQKEGGDIWVEPSINGRTVRMVLDTGCPDTTIGKEQLEQIGLKAPSGPPTGTTGGASNSARIPYWAMKARVKLGAIEKDIKVDVMETNSAMPLLGQNFFNEFDFTIDQGAGRVHFRQKALNQGTTVRNAITVPFEFRKAGKRIVLKLEINGQAHPVMFDTGNTASALTFENVKQAERYGARVPDDAEESRTSGVSGSGRVKNFIVAHLRLGQIDAYNVSCSVHCDNDDEEGLPLLGEPFWKNYQYTVDNKNKLLHFVRR